MLFINAMQSGCGTTLPSVDMVNTAKCMLIRAASAEHVVDKQYLPLMGHWDSLCPILFHHQEDLLTLFRQ